MWAFRAGFANLREFTLADLLLLNGMYLTAKVKSTIQS